MAEQSLDSLVVIKQNEKYTDCYWFYYAESHYSTINRNPFANCQTASIAHFENICSLMKNQPKVADLFFKKLYTYVGKPQIMVDVLQGHCDSIEKYFPKSAIISKSKYRNNTGSQMCLYLINYSSKI